jgi:hypothetical protein
MQGCNCFGLSSYQFFSEQSLRSFSNASLSLTHDSQPDRYINVQISVHVSVHISVHARCMQGACKVHVSVHIGVHVTMHHLGGVLT